MDTTGRIRTIVTALALAATMLLATGCRGPGSKGWKFSNMFDVDVTPWSHDEDEVQTPKRMVSTWTDTVLHQTSKTPQRGFGGRLIFYGEEADKPVLVEGQLVIYAFNETNRLPTDNKPTRRYVFPADQVARRMSKTKLGPSYSFWLPWDEVGGPQTDVSLIARFEPTDGAIVVGEQTRHLLPGELRGDVQLAGNTPPRLPAGVPMRPAALQLSDLAAAAGATNGLQLASYEEPADAPQLQPTQPQNAPQRRMTTTSISLPENFRIQGGGSTPTVPAGNVSLPGNVMAQPQAPPPNYGALAAPIGVPQPNARQTGVVPNFQSTVRPMQQLPPTQAVYPGFMTPQQSPLGNGFVAPLGPPQHALQQAPSSVGPISAPPAAPIMPGQPPLTTASGWATVSYPPPGAPQPSFGYSPPPPQAPATPAFR